MSGKVMSWLLEEDNPSVRFYTMTTLLGRSADDNDVREAKKRIMETGAVPKILRVQNEDGSFGTPERFYVDKYKGTVWNLLMLAQLGADPADPRIRKTCEFILHHSQNQDSGGFSYTQSMKTGGGLSSGVIPCLTGNMVYSLVSLGYMDDSRVQKAIEWITLYQRADDGIAKAPEGSVYERLEPCWGRHSCHMGVAKSLKALASIPTDRRSPDVHAKIGQLSEYFLLHHLYKKSKNLAEVSRPGWLRLGFPLMYQTDILELLGIFHDLGIHDPRLRDAREILTGKQLQDGTWNLENSFNGRMLVNVDMKGQPSKWITLKALQILQDDV